MKPDTVNAMTHLIAEIRGAIPFDLPEAKVCAGPCTGCPKKLLEFLDTELEDWEQRLNRQQVPQLGDVKKLARTGHKIYAVLKRNGLINAPG